MNNNDRDWMERYIYEVIRRVPSAQREEIRMELTELIEEMYDSEGGNMASVLNKLGDPAQFAKKYRDENDYVISPEYYDNYVWVLKIVLLCTAFAITISSAVSWISNGASRSFIGTGNSMLGGFIYAFGFVTLIFAVLERLKVKVDLTQAKDWTADTFHANSVQKSWSAKQLSPVPHKKGLISRGESAFSVVFLFIFCAVLIFAPQLIGAYDFDNGKLVRTISIFNLEQWHVIFPFLFVSFFIALVDQIIKLILGCYCKIVMISNIIAGTLQLVLSVITIKFLPFWNPDFAKDLSEMAGFRITAKGDLLLYWNTPFISNILLLIILICTIAEIATTIYKTYRYGADRPY